MSNSTTRYEDISNKIEEYSCERFQDWIMQDLCLMIIYYYFCRNIKLCIF